MLFSALLVRSYLANFSVKAFSLNQEMTSGVSLAVLTTTWSKHVLTSMAEFETRHLNAVDAEIDRTNEVLGLRN